MPILRLKISQPESGWRVLSDFVNKENEWKNRAHHGSGMNEFLGRKINNYFSKRNKAPNCSDVKHDRTSKNFEIPLSEEITSKVICLANHLGIPPAALISRIILDPLLLATD